MRWYDGPGNVTGIRVIKALSKTDYEKGALFVRQQRGGQAGEDGRITMA